MYLCFFRALCPESGVFPCSPSLLWFRFWCCLCACVRVFLFCVWRCLCCVTVGICDVLMNRFYGLWCCFCAILWYVTVLVMRLTVILFYDLCKLGILQVWVFCVAVVRSRVTGFWNFAIFILILVTLFLAWGGIFGYRLDEKISDWLRIGEQVGL